MSDEPDIRERDLDRLWAAERERRRAIAARVAAAPARPRAARPGTTAGWVAAAAVAFAAGLSGSLLYESAPPLLPLVLLGSGLLVGALIDGSWATGWTGAALGIAAAGVTRPGLVNGPDIAPYVTMVSGFVVALVLFGPGWFFGAAIRATRTPIDERRRPPMTYAVLGSILLAIPVAVLIAYVVALVQGGFCCR